MTDQEIFEVMVTGVVAQGGPSYSPQWAAHEDEWYPALLGDAERMMPVGHLLPRELVVENPNSTAYHLHREHALPPDLNIHYGLIREVEMAHNRNFTDYVDRRRGPLPDCDQRFMDAFLSRCAEVARARGLLMPGARAQLMAA